MPSPPSLFRFALALCVLLATGHLFWRLHPLPTSRQSGRQVESTLRLPPSEPSQALLDWAAHFAGAGAAKAGREARLQEGIKLACDRADTMKRLMRENPAKAIAEALTFEEWESLPPEVLPFVEKPFSATADWNRYPICNQPTQGHNSYFASLTLPTGEDLDAIVYGRRANLMSKRQVPVQGISLHGFAVIREEVLLQLPNSSANQRKVLSHFPPGQPDSSLSFATGRPVGSNPVHAVCGGRLYTFTTEAELAEFNSRLIALDGLPGPLAGSSALTPPQPYAPNATGGFNWPAAEAYAYAQASLWTETKKKLFLIRVNFPNNLAVPVTQAAALAEINGASSDLIRAMSYGKTWIEGGVSASVYTLPQNSTYYLNSGGSARNSELIRDARNAFRNTKSGADAAINIGPVINTGNGDSGGLGDYDIVGVFFAEVGMAYAGLAGGGNLWVQNANYTSLYVHEWGHNYGLGHANFWQTSDGSVSGTGTNEEYGDIFDVMGSGPAPQGHFHPQGKSHLNWLSTSDWSDATALGSATYRIYRIDDANTTGKPRGVRITKTKGATADGYFWLGFRPAFTDFPTLQRGAYLNWQQADDHRSWLLDTTPGSNGGKDDGVILPGRTFGDSSTRVYITPLGTGGTGSEQYLDVRVNVNQTPNSPPTAAAISGPGTVAARTNTPFSVTGNDSNGDSLAYYWTSGDGSIQDNTATPNLRWAVGGNYSLQVTVSDMKGGTGSQSKSVTVTDPIDTWTLHSTGTTGDLQEVIQANGRFVAADYWGTVYLSWNGTSWTNSGALPGFEREPRIAFGNDRFVIGGRSNSGVTAHLSYSSDGRTWTTASYPNGLPQIQAVAFGNGQFLAAGDDGTILRSPDGITWTLTTVAGAPDFRRLTWNGTTWMSIALDTVQVRPEVVWTSLDGITWTQRDELGVDVFATYGRDGVFYALGWYTGVMVSADQGVTWQDAALPTTTRWTTYRMAVADDGTFLALAEAMDESGTPAALLVSSDGIQWSRSTANGGNLAVAEANSLTFGAGRFLAISDNGDVHTSGSFFPDNVSPVPSLTSAPASASARTPVSFAASGMDGNGDALRFVWDLGPEYPLQDGAAISPVYPFGGSYAVTLRVLDGRGGMTALTHNLTVNDPARTFTQRESGTTSNLRALAANGNLVVAAGDSGVIRTSSDGLTWVTRSISEFAGNVAFYDAVWDGNQFILAGQDYSFAIGDWYGAVYTSSDGITWTRRFSDAAGNSVLYAIATNGTVSVAAGENGTVRRSTNGGQTWTAVTISGVTSSHTFEGMAWNGNVFALTGYTGGNGGVKVFTSADGSGWVDRSSGAGVASWQDLRSIAWLNDRFVSSGFYSALRTSTNGGVSFTTTRGPREETPAMASGNGIYFAAGVNWDDSEADVDLLSLDGTTWYSFPAPTTSDRYAAAFFKNRFLTVGEAGSIWQSDTVPAADPFLTWQATNFPAGGVAAEATSDPDGDGLNNLEEFAFSRSPASGLGANGAAGRAYPVWRSSRTWLHLDFPEPVPSGTLIYTVQGSTEPSGPWTAVASKTGTSPWAWQSAGTARITIGSLSAGRIPVEVGVPDSALGEPRYFLRLQITRTP